MNITTTTEDYVQLLTCLGEIWGESKQYLPEYSDRKSECTRRLRYNNRMRDAMSASWRWRGGGFPRALELGQSYGKGL